MVNWSEVLEDNSAREQIVRFARGELSGDNLYQWFIGSEHAGTIREQVRSGVARFRENSRKALRRRGVTV